MPGAVAVAGAGRTRALVVFELCEIGECLTSWQSGIVDYDGPSRRRSFNVQ